VPFTEFPSAIDTAPRRRSRLSTLSNSDPDLIAASKARLGVPFDETIVAGEIGSYKPALGHWSEFAARTGADPTTHIHVAASLFHDIGPANELGLRSIWINRLGETPGPVPTRELPDLSRLPDTLDELVPGAL
jgi:FMN phosphatase YigB (HAD superfamily)